MFFFFSFSLAIKSKGEPRSPLHEASPLTSEGERARGGEQVAPPMETTAAARCYLTAASCGDSSPPWRCGNISRSEQEAAKVDLTGRCALLSEENR